MKLVMDPCNYFRKEDLPRMQPMLAEMFKRVGREIVVAHAKDVKAAADGTDLPAAGLGVLVWWGATTPTAAGAGDPGTDRRRRRVRFPSRSAR